MGHKLYFVSTFNDKDFAVFFTKKKKQDKFAKNYDLICLSIPSVIAFPCYSL